MDTKHTAQGPEYPRNKQYSSLYIIAPSCRFFLGVLHPFYLQGVDESKVVQCDVIVVVLDVTEGFLMVLHECVDLTIFPLKEKKHSNRAVYTRENKPRITQSAACVSRELLV